MKYYVALYLTDGSKEELTNFLCDSREMAFDLIATLISRDYIKTEDCVIMVQSIVKAVIFEAYEEDK